VFPLPREKECPYLRCSRSLEIDFLERDFLSIYGVPALLRKILLVFAVFPLPGKRFPRETLLVFTVFPLPRERFCGYLQCPRSLERDFCREILSIFMVFPIPWERFCWFPLLGRRLPGEGDFVGIYGVPAPLRKILSVFTVFPLPGKRFSGERFCLYLRCSRSLEKDLVGIYSVPAPWEDISWREICWYLRCSRSLKKDFVGFYGVLCPWKGISLREILSVFAVFPLPWNIFCLY